MERLRLSVTGVAAGGDGIARTAEGRVAFVAGGLPGEEVVAEVVETRRDYLRTAVVEVVEAHPGRVAPPCPRLEAGCGGCDLQHADLPTQRQLKHSIAVDALRRIGRIAEPPVDGEVGGVAPDAYRTSVRAAVEGGRLGLRRRRSHEVVATDGCLVAHPLVEELLRESHLPDARDALVRVGASSGERMVVAWPRPGRAASVPEGAQLAAGPGARPGWPAIHEEVLGHRLRVSAGSFFQSGPAAAALLAEEVDAAVDAALDQPDAVLVDLYAGVGLLGAVVAGRRPGTRLVAVESNGSAAADARANLSRLDAEVVRLPVEEIEAEGEAAAVVADPARGGLGLGGADAVAALDAPVVVLVSCDPAALGRDARLLHDRGYRLERTRVLDLFPHTSHLEAVSRFERVPPPEPVEAEPPPLSKRAARRRPRPR